MVEKRKNWNGLISGFNASDLVFLDESGCNTDMTRRYAYSLGGSRAVDSAPLSKPKNTTILSSIQLDGTLHCTTFSGGTTVAHFKQYLKEDLLPHLNGDSVLVMDNMKSHHAKAVKDLLDSSGVRYIYLPPYSPDLNPIEKLWSKVKALLRKFKARSPDALPNAIQHAFQNASPSDCSGWFRSCAIEEKRHIVQNIYNQNVRDYDDDFVNMRFKKIMSREIRDVQKDVQPFS